MNSLALSLVGTVTVFVLLKQWSATRRRKFLPPGPPGLPFFGNSFNWPAGQPWTTLTEWAQKYGDIMYAKVGRSEIVVVNSHTVATALLAGKSAQYSDRPPQHFVGEMVGWGPSLLLQSDGPELHEQRRMFTQVLGTRKNIEVFESRIERRIAQFVRRLLKSSEPNVPSLARWLAGVIILDVTFSHKVSDQGEDELLSLAKQVVEDFNAAATPAQH